MKLQKLLSLIRKGVDDYQMINDGDVIGVGISGGKDSLALLYGLKHLQYFYPKKFSLVGITVSLGFEGTDYTPVKKFCAELDIPYFIAETDIGEIIFDIRKEKNPCSLCSKMRKGSLHDEALKHGVNKIALGHNKDDVIQTLFMSLFYEGRIHTFSPVSYLDRKNLYNIRPLIYASEDEIRSFVNKYEIETVRNLCPADGNTKREDMKNFIEENNGKYINFSEKVFTAIKNSGIEGWDGFV